MKIYLNLWQKCIRNIKIPLSNYCEVETNHSSWENNVNLLKCNTQMVDCGGVSEWRMKHCKVLMGKHITTALEVTTGKSWESAGGREGGRVIERTGGAYLLLVKCGSRTEVQLMRHKEARWSFPMRNIQTEQVVWWIKEFKKHPFLRM